MANPNLGDVLTYNGSAWVNQPWVQGPFGVATIPVYPFHALAGSTAFFVTNQLGTSIAGFYNSSGKQWSLRVDSSTGTLFIRDDNLGGLAERIALTTPVGNFGIGTTSPDSLLQVNGSIATTVANKTAAYTLLSTDSVITADATGGAFTVTLPTAVGIAGRAYTVKKIDSSANAVTVGTTSSQTIDGATTYALSSRYQFVTVVSDGANWQIVAK